MQRNGDSCMTHFVSHSQMGFCHIGRDVKLAAIRLHELDLLSLEDILQCVGFSERTFYRILALWRETGDVVKPKKTHLGRPRSLDYDDLQYLLILVCDNPDYFLDELLDLLKTNRFISVHFTTIHRELERAGVSRKKLKRSLQREMKIDVLPLPSKCHSILLASWGSSTKPRKIRGHQAEHMDDRRKGDGRRRSRSFCEVDVYPRRHCFQLMVLLQGQLLRVL